MTSNNNLSCIPFYRNLEEQDYRKWYAYGDKFPNRVPGDYLVPFYFVIPPFPSGEPWGFDYVKIYKACDNGGDPILDLGSFNLSFSSAFDNKGENFYMGAMRDNSLVIKEVNPYYSEVIYFAKNKIH